MSYLSEIKRSRAIVFRRLYFKRKYYGTGYESTWQEIDSARIKKWGKNSFNISDVKVNFFNLSGQSIQLDNTDSFFDKETNYRSFFYNTVSRYGILVKIEAGYVGEDGTEYPDDPIIFTGYLRDDIKTGSDGIINLKFRHAGSILEDVKADNIVLTGSQTANDIITQIQNYTNGSGDLIFQGIISTWHILSTTSLYPNLDTSTAVEGDSMWNLITKLAEAENAITYVSRNGEFYFAANDYTEDVTEDDRWHFSGVGDNSRTHGHNIKDLKSFYAPVSKIYNYVQIKFKEADTSTSYLTKKESWTWGDSSSSFRYGERKYEIDNDWVNTATAQIIIDDLFDNNSELKEELAITTQFIPNVNPWEIVTATYITPRIEGSTLWGHFVWGGDVYTRASGRLINIDNEYFKIIKVSQDLDKFESAFTMREAIKPESGFNSGSFNRDYFNE